MSERVAPWEGVASSGNRENMLNDSYFYLVAMVIFSCMALSNLHLQPRTSAQIAPRI